MRQWLAMIAAVLTAAPVGAQGRTLGFRVAPDVAVRIQNLVGQTRVTGWDRDSIAVTATIPPGGGSLYGGGSARMAKLGIEGQNPSLAGPGAVLEVWVPHGARVWIKSAAAAVEVTDVRGEVEVTSVTGRVVLDGAPRVASLETIDGDVDVTGAATVVRIRTGAGRVRVTGVRGDLAVTTVQGAITIDSKELLSARVETVSGPVDVRAAVPPDGQLEVETHDGAVGLTLPASIDARFDLGTIKGVIATRLSGDSERRHERSVRFAVGKKAGAGRGASITVRTFSGDIRIDSNP